MDKIIKLFWEVVNLKTEGLCKENYQIDVNGRLNYFNRSR